MVVAYQRNKWFQPNGLSPCSLAIGYHDDKNMRIWLKRSCHPSHSLLWSLKKNIAVIAIDLVVRFGKMMECTPWVEFVWQEVLPSQILDCYCVCCELLSASKADALQFVNMVCLPLIAEQNAHEICLTQECLQIVRRLLWKQTTTDSLRNNNAMFHGNLWPSSFEELSTWMVDPKLHALSEAKLDCMIGWFFNWKLTQLI